MRIPESFMRYLKPALILYGIKAAVSIIVFLPVFVFLSGKFSVSFLGDKFWPLPSDMALFEAVWQMQDILYILIPILLLAVAIHFVLNQFAYGGVYRFMIRNESLTSANFFSAGGRYFWGFMKIALAGIAVFVFVFLAAELIGTAFGKLFGLFGKNIGRFVMMMTVFTLIYVFMAYLVILRFALIKNDNSNFQRAFLTAKDILSGKLRYFIILNLMTGVGSFISLAIVLFLVSLVYRLTFYPPVYFIVLLVQQLAVVWICLLEVFQIKINMRFLKEIENGTSLG